MPASVGVTVDHRVSRYDMGCRRVTAPVCVILQQAVGWLSCVVLGARSRRAGGQSLGQPRRQITSRAEDPPISHAPLSPLPQTNTVVSSYDPNSDIVAGQYRSSRGLCPTRNITRRARSDAASVGIDRRWSACYASTTKILRIRRLVISRLLLLSRMTAGPIQISTASQLL